MFLHVMITYFEVHRSMPQIDACWYCVERTETAIFFKSQNYSSGYLVVVGNG
jgi:hypothetical protein